MSFSLRLIGLALLLSVVVRADEVTARVVILANSRESGSVSLANYYAERRGVPIDNIIALPMSADESITWREFVDTIFNPLQAELVKRGWLDAMAMDLTDEAGRKKYVISGHSISYLTVCRGVPLKIAGGPLIPSESSTQAGSSAFKTNAAAVDSELALAALTGTPMVAFVPNPLLGNDHPTSVELNQVIKVSRLDGPTYADARRLIDNAIKAEEQGLIGRAYVDIGGPYASGDAWFEDAAKQLSDLPYDLAVDRAGGSLGVTARFDAPALYFGWYAGQLNGPFTQKDFKFPPGAVAMHLHSFSAVTLRSSTSAWVGPLVARGVTATFGNVNEPYLPLVHQPQLVVKSLIRGETFGDAAAYSVMGYSWQAIAVGDPLYRPFKVSLAEQWARRDKLTDELRPYVVLSRMRELDRAGDRNAAIWAGLEAQKRGYSLAVALAVADLQRAADDVAGVRETLIDGVKIRKFSERESPLAALLAKNLVELGDHKSALTVWMTVLGTSSLPKDMRVQWLPTAIAVARAAKDERQAVRWDEMYRELTTVADGKSTDKK